MTEEEFLEELYYQLPYSEIPSDEQAQGVYAFILRHLLNDVIDPRDSARGIIFSLESRLKELVEN